MNWLRENWLFVLIIVAILLLAFVLPFFYDYPTKKEYENWKQNLTDEQIEDYIYQQKEQGEFYAP